MLSLRQAVSTIVHDPATSRIVMVHYSGRSWSREPAWTIPGGKAEDGDRTLDEAAARELSEETGLVVAPADLRLVHTVQVREGWDGKGPFLLTVFAATAWSGQLANREPGKHLEVRWSPAAELPMPMFPTCYAAVRAYLDGGRGFSTWGWDQVGNSPTLVRG